MSYIVCYNNAVINEVEETYMRHPKDINTLLNLAAQGDNRARGQIGSMYYYGRGGVEQNYTEAVKWFKAAG